MNHAFRIEKLQKCRYSGSGGLLHLRVQSAISKESHGSVDCLGGQKGMPDPPAIADRAHERDLQQAISWRE